MPNSLTVKGAVGLSWEVSVVRKLAESSSSGEGLPKGRKWARRFVREAFASGIVVDRLTWLRLLHIHISSCPPHVTQ